jgi:uncharacterized protein
MSQPWEITPEKVAAAVRRIVDIARPRKVILFGSAARGETKPDSDVDFLVVVGNEIESPRRESVRIRRALRGISMPMDILVVSEQRLQQLGNQPGLVYRAALREGHHVYDAASQQ